MRILIIYRILYVAEDFYSDHNLAFMTDFPAMFDDFDYRRWETFPKPAMICNDMML